MYIGEHAGGLYALPSLVEEGSPLVEVLAAMIARIPFNIQILDTASLHFLFFFPGKSFID